MKITSSPDPFMCFKQLRKQTKKCIATSYHQYLQSLSKKLKVDPKTFWSFHAIESKTKRLPAVVTYKDWSASESVDKAALFNEFFSSVYSSDNVNYEDLQVDVLYPSFLFEISTTQSEVENILVNLDAKKASGVDGILGRILKLCAREIYPPVIDLGQMSGKNYPSCHLLSCFTFSYWLAAWLCERAFLYNSAGPHSPYVEQSAGCRSPGWCRVFGLC